MPPSPSNQLHTIPVSINHQNDGTIEASLVQEEIGNQEYDEQAVAVSQEYDYNQGESKHGEESGSRDTDGFATYRLNENTNRASIQSRSVKCVLHFNHYLHEYRKSDLNILDIPLASINDNLYKGFVLYLGKDARAYCNEDNERLSHQTSDNYLSGIKSIISERALEENINPPVVLSDANTKKYRKLLHSMYLEFSITNNKSMSDPHIAATQHDRIASAMCCAWTNNVKSAEFMNLNNSKYQYTGRGSEIALGRHEDIL